MHGSVGGIGSRPPLLGHGGEPELPIHKVCELVFRGCRTLPPRWIRWGSRAARPRWERSRRSLPPARAPAARLRCAWRNHLYTIPARAPAARLYARSISDTLRCLGCLRCLRCLQCLRCLRCLRCLPPIYYIYTDYINGQAPPTTN